jgi:hypothetical protein
VIAAIARDLKTRSAFRVLVLRATDVPALSCSFISITSCSGFPMLLRWFSFPDFPLRPSRSLR